MLDEDLKVITQKKVATYALLPDLQPYEPMFLMLSHFKFEESSNLRSRFFGYRGRLEDIYRATVILTKASTVERFKLSLRCLELWTEDKDLEERCTYRCRR